MHRENKNGDPANNETTVFQETENICLHEKDHLPLEMDGFIRQSVEIDATAHILASSPQHASGKPH